MRLYLYDLYWATELSLLDCHVFDEKIGSESVTSIFVKVILLNEQHAIKNDQINCEDHNFEQNKSLKPPV